MLAFPTLVEERRRQKGSGSSHFRRWGFAGFMLNFPGPGVSGAGAALNAS